MNRDKKIFLALIIFGALVFFNAQPVLAVDNSALIAQLQQEIASLIRQIIALLQQQIKAGTNNNSKTATLTVNASGVTAYVSINGGSQFAYTSPITLNNGDKYSVVASASGSNGAGNSTSKCNGTASSGGTYVCNININNY
jgi:hypothetical protein